MSPSQEILILLLETHKPSKYDASIQPRQLDQRGSMLSSNNPIKIDLMLTNQKHKSINSQILLKLVYLTITKSYQLFQNHLASKVYQE